VNNDAKNTFSNKLFRITNFVSQNIISSVIKVFDRSSVTRANLVPLDGSGAKQLNQFPVILESKKSFVFSLLFLNRNPKDSFVSLPFRMVSILYLLLQHSPSTAMKRCFQFFHLLYSLAVVAQQGSSINTPLVIKQLTPEGIFLNKG
jgi:hypothetical protein